MIDISDEQENNESAPPREDRPPAESQSAVFRLVRLGAAVETRPDALRYRGFKCALEQCEFGWYRGGFAFRPKELGRRAFLLPREDLDDAVRLTRAPLPAAYSR